jgi:uncharacterized protein (TIGR03086 family)
MDAVANFKATATLMDSLLAGLTEDQMDRPTPCEAWTVTDLTDHVVGNLFNSFAHWAGVDREHRPTAVPAEVRQRYAAGVETVAEAYEAPGILDKTLATPIGDFPGAAVLGVCFADQLTHVWDLSRALGRTVDVPDQLAEDAIAVWTGFISAPLRNGTTFAEPVEPGPDASGLDRLAAFTGRSI